MRPRFLVTAATALIVASLLSPAQVRAASNILFILDSSGSMWGQLDGKAKMETAKTALSKLVGDLPADTGVGIMVYGHRLGRKEPGACTDIELLKSVGRATPDDVAAWLEGINPKGKTPIAGSLRQAPGAFAGLEKFNNNIVLISDGIETCDGDPCAVAGELAKSNINVRVHVVGFDISNEDRAQLQCIAKLGNGKYFAANSTKDFTRAVTEAVKIAQVETKPAPEPTPQQPKPVLYFEDTFDGEDLADHWEVAKPNPDAFIVEDGVLMVVSGTVGSLASETVENVFRLSKPLPKGDWTITAKFSVEFQAGRERTFIGIVENGDNHLEIAVQAVIVPWGNNAKAAIDVVGLKRSKGKTKVTTRRLWFSGRNIDPNNFVGETKGFPQPILLRLQKQGKSYIGSAMLEGAKEWVVLDKYSILRRLKGSVSLGFHQSAKTTKESTAKIDWIKIETLE